MKGITNIKSIIIAVFITAGASHAQILGDFIGEWNGVENLHSSTTSYLNKSISIEISEGGDWEGYLIYTSTSDFIYENSLDWAYHYIGFDKLTDQLIFLRRWITPIGTVGFEEIIYDLVDWDTDSFTAEHYSADSETHHEIIVSRNTLNLEELIPEKMSLHQNYPNPFNPTTTIVVELEKESIGSLIIYNINGQIVKSLHQGQISSGVIRYQWDGRNDLGYEVSGGTYIYRLQIDGTTQSHKMVLLK